jgi:protein-tyrosine-phosphatase
MDKKLEGRMYDTPINVLFVGTGNCVRSILAEDLLNRWGRGTFVGYSAGTHPKGCVHPFALKLLEYVKFPTHDLRSKSWNEFLAPYAPGFDFVFTVCDDAACDICPVWPGQPMTAHWGIADPAATEGSNKEQWAAFRSAFVELESRIKSFTGLPIRSLDRIYLQQQIDAIGRNFPRDQVA